MKLIDYYRRDDGVLHEYYFEFGVFKWITFFSVTLWLNEEYYSEYYHIPDIKITFGNFCLVNITIYFLKHSFFLEIFDLRKDRETIDDYRNYDAQEQNPN